MSLGFSAISEAPISGVQFAGTGPTYSETGLSVSFNLTADCTASNTNPAAVGFVAAREAILFDNPLSIGRVIRLPPTLTDDIWLLTIAYDTAPTSWLDWLGSNGWNILFSSTSGAGLAFAVKTMGNTPDTLLILDNTTATPGNDGVLVAQAFRGQRPNNPVHDIGAYHASGTSALPDSPSLTTTVDGSRVFTLVVGDDDYGALAGSPAGYGDLIFLSSGAPGDTDLKAVAAMGSLVQPTAGAINPTPWDFTPFNDVWSGSTVALVPSVSSATYDETGLRVSVSLKVSSRQTNPNPAAYGWVSSFADLVPPGTSTGTGTVRLSPSLEDDLWIVQICIDSMIDLPKPPAWMLANGWTLIWDGGGGDPDNWLLYKFMGSTPDTTIEVEHSIFNDYTMNVVAQCFRGINKGSPFDVASTRTLGGSGDPDSPSITPITNGCVIVITAAGDDDSGSLTTVPAGFGNVVFQATGSLSATLGETTAAMANLIQGAAAPIDPAVWNWASFSDQWTAHSIALRPGATYDESGLTVTVNLSTATSDKQKANEGGLSAPFTLDAQGTDTVDLKESLSVAYTASGVATSKLKAKEVAAVTVNYTITVSDVRTYSESVTATVNYSVAITNTVDFTDHATTTFNLSVAFTDLKTMTEALTALVNYTLTLNDILTMGEHGTATVNFTVFVTDYHDSGGINETGRLAQFTLSTAATDTAAMNDPTTVTLNLTTTTLDTVSVNESVTTNVTFTAVATSAATLTEALTTTVTFTVTITDSFFYDETGLATQFTLATIGNEALTIGESVTTTVTYTTASVVIVSKNEPTTVTCQFTTATLNTVALTNSVATAVEFATTATDSWYIYLPPGTGKGVSAAGMGRGLSNPSEVRGKSTAGMGLNTTNSQGGEGESQ